MIVPFDCPACKATIEAEVKGLKRRVVTCPSCEESVQVPDDVEIGPGVVIGNGYRLERRLGESSLGENYLATGQEDGRQYKVEILSGETSRDQEKVTRLMQETDLVATLDHPNIEQAIEAGQDSETYFLVTAYEPSATLHEYLADNAPLPCDRALEIIRQVASALRHAWDERKILHRDVKPQNIFVTDDGSVRLSGFGIAKSSEGQNLGLTGAGFTIGTPEYMSPEQIRAEENLDFRADLYSLGVVLYQCVVGSLPFEDPAPMLLVQKHMDELPEPPIDRNSRVTPACNAVVLRMLEKDPDDRYQSWAELIAALEQAKGDAAGKGRSGGGGGNKPLFIALVVGMGVVILLLVVLVVLLMMRGG